MAALESAISAMQGDAVSAAIAAAVIAVTIGIIAMVRRKV
jgi:hypothetical protein